MGNTCSSDKSTETTDGSKPEDKPTEEHTSDQTGEDGVTGGEDDQEGDAA